MQTYWEGKRRRLWGWRRRVSSTLTNTGGHMPPPGGGRSSAAPCARDFRCSTSKRLFTPWIMKSSQRPCKIWHLLLNSSWDDYYRLCQENVRVNMEFEIYKRYISRPTLFTHMVQQVLCGERQKRCFGRKKQEAMAEKCCYDKVLMRFSWGR